MVVVLMTELHCERKEANMCTFRKFVTTYSVIPISGQLYLAVTRLVLNFVQWSWPRIGSQRSTPKTRIVSEEWFTSQAFLVMTFKVYFERTKGKGFCQVSTFSIRVLIDNLKTYTVFSGITLINTLAWLSQIWPEISKFRIFRSSSHFGHESRGTIENVARRGTSKFTKFSLGFVRHRQKLFADLG